MSKDLYITYDHLTFLQAMSILLTQGPICEILRIGDFKKLNFFESAIFNFFFKIFFFLLHSHEKSVQIYMVEWMGRNFDVFPGFQKIPCYA